jgi:paired amphipathic helix protein Sin3a
MNSHTDEVSHRDRESAERHHRDQYPTGTPHHSNTASLQIHQPVASRISGVIHSPGGLLANHGGSGPPIPLGAPQGSVNTFGPLQNETNRPHQHNAQNASNQMFGAIGGPAAGPSVAGGSSGPVFGGPLQQENIRPGPGQAIIPFGSSSGNSIGPAITNPHTPMAAGSAGSNNGALQQGQQPILNVSYTDYTSTPLYLTIRTLALLPNLLLFAFTANSIQYAIRTLLIISPHGLHEPIYPSFSLGREWASPLPRVKLYLVLL